MLVSIQDILLDVQYSIQKFDERPFLTKTGFLFFLSLSLQFRKMRVSIQGILLDAQNSIKKFGNRPILNIELSFSFLSLSLQFR